MCREKVRENDYNTKIERISQLEGELRKNLTELKDKQKNVSLREKQLEGQDTTIKEREEKLKTLVADEKRRSSINLQTNTKEFRTEILRLKDENCTLEQKCKEMQGHDEMSKNMKKELEKNQSLLNDSTNENEELKKKIAELEAKLEQALKAKAFYKTAFENSEIKIQQLTEENNRNKSNQILEQKEEIQRLRSELAITHQRNEEKLVNFARMGTNIHTAPRPESHSTTQLPSFSDTSSEATTVIPSNVVSKVAEKAVNNNERRFGKHPGSLNAPLSDAKDQLSRLQKEKAMFLKTNVYTEEDPIVKQLNEKIEMLLQVEEQS